MGNTLSQGVVQDYTALLSKLGEATRINSDDPYWRQLFAFPLPLSQLDPKLVEQQIITGCCSSLGKAPQSLKLSLDDCQAATQSRAVQHEICVCIQSAIMDTPRTCKSCSIMSLEQLLQARSMSRNVSQQLMLFVWPESFFSTFLRASLLYSWQLSLQIQLMMQVA